MNRYLILLLVLCVVQTSASVANELTQRIVLLGDAGYSSLTPLEPSLKLAADNVQQAPDKTKVLF